LEVTGECNEPTSNKLVEVHDVEYTYPETGS
jgi:hypothetical protein